jgi:hypothetical protein
LERQLSESVDGINASHVARYRFAASLNHKLRIIDVACGCGYGSKILHDAGNEVFGIDICREAIEHAKRFFPGPTYVCTDITECDDFFHVFGNVLVSFETIEHIRCPEKILENQYLRKLICSVPNEEHYPFKASQFANDEYPHLRHYTPSEFDALLEGCGWKIESRHCQINKFSEVTDGTEGKFLVYVCRRS